LPVNALCNKQFAAELVGAAGGDRRIDAGLPVAGALAGAMVLAPGLASAATGLGKAPGCTDSLINIGATVHPVALSGTVSVTVSYDRTNANGSVIAGSHTRSPRQSR
jgi:hypothetical protein